MTDTIGEILTLVERHHWRIFPSLIDGNRKQPAIKDWPNAASRDPDQIRAWFTRRELIPSLVTGPRNGIVVLDVDVGTDRGGRRYSGFDSLATIFHWTEAPPVPCVHTRR